MKYFAKILPLIFIFAACNDDDDNSASNNGTNQQPPSPREEYIENLLGIWDLTDVRYSFTLPPFQQGLPPIPISGKGEDVNGLFNMKDDPQEINYNLSFSAALPNPLTGDSIDVPISFGNRGSYSINEDATKITVTNDDSTKTVLEILLDRPNRQTFRTVQPLAIPLSDTVDVTAELTIER